MKSDKLRISKKDIMTMYEEIRTFTHDFELITKKNPNGTHLFWTWRFKEETIEDISTPNTYDMLDGMLKAFHSDPVPKDEQTTEEKLEHAFDDIRMNEEVVRVLQSLPPE